MTDMQEMMWDVLCEMSGEDVQEYLPTIMVISF